MKAAVCHEFGKPLVIEEVELLPPKTGEVQVKLAACAICHSDILYAEGAWAEISLLFMDTKPPELWKVWVME
jgi:Zn-dependent alcohol dehydrogenases